VVTHHLTEIKISKIPSGNFLSIANIIMVDETLDKAKGLLHASQPQECINLLLPKAEQDPNNVLILQTLGEAYVEIGEPANAYALFEKSAELDGEGKQGGFEKFLWLGQLNGDRIGLGWYEIGLNGLREQYSHASQEEDIAFLKKKISQGLCGMIEIWMTDLCMEPEAESTCDKLITEALMVDDTEAENWSVLGSIRISQQRNHDATDALSKSFMFYNSRHLSNDEVPALIRLCQNMLEMQLLENTVALTLKTIRLDDNIIEVYYLNGLAHFGLFEQFKNQGDQDNMYRNGSKASDSFNLILSMMEDDPENKDEELAENVNGMLASIGEIPEGYSDDEDDDNQEDDEDLKALEDD
jgi:tetratricopeptide (TPR) repeat protein